MNMQIMSVILGMVILIETVVVLFFTTRIHRKKTNSEELFATRKLIKKIFLKNMWHSIDDVMSVLIKDSTDINFKLR